MSKIATDMRSLGLMRALIQLLKITPLVKPPKRMGGDKSLEKIPKHLMG